MKVTELTDDERRKLLSGKDSGGFAEREVAYAYDGWNTGGVNEGHEYDVFRTSGALGEVKSTANRIGVDAQYPADGRFILRKSQHDRLVEYDRAEATSYYFFVLFDLRRRDGPALARMKRLKPATVGRRIGARGGWNESGHSNYEQEFKLPIEAVFPEVSLDD